MSKERGPLQINLEWGGGDIFDKIENPEVKKRKHTKIIDIADELKPGKWNTVSIVISPAKAEDLKDIKMSLQTDQVIMLK